MQTFLKNKLVVNFPYKSFLSLLFVEWKNDLLTRMGDLLNKEFNYLTYKLKICREINNIFKNFYPCIR
jgi:hypothetical protein